MRARASRGSPVASLAGGVFANPLLRRELVGLLRTRRAFWLLVLLVISSCSLSLFAWPSQADSMIAIRRSDAFLTFTMVQLAVALLITPAFTAGAIAGERERGTYELLYTSLLSPLAIISAKLLASIGYVLILLVATAPGICMLYLQGGIDFSMVVWAYAITILAVLSSGLICLTASIRSDRTLQAVIRGFLWVLLWQLGLMAILGLIFMVIWQGRQPPEPAMRLMFSISPIPALISIVENVGFGGRNEFAYLYSTYAGVLALAHFVYLLIRVRVPDLVRRRRGSARGTRRGMPTGVRRAAVAQLVLRLGRRGLPVFSNPVFMKEVRSEFISRPWYWRLVILVCVLVFTLLATAGIPFPAKIGVTGFIAMVLSTLLIAGALASSLPKEIDQGNLDLLRVTLVPLRGILAGKAFAAVYGVSGILGVALLYLLGLPFYGLVSPKFFTRNYYEETIIAGDDALELVANLYLLTVLVVGLHTVFLVAISSFFAVVCRRTLSALLWSLVSLLGIFLGLPLLIFAMVVAIGKARSPDADFLNFYYGTSPFMTWAMGVDGFFTEQLPDRSFLRDRYHPGTVLSWFSFLYLSASAIFGGLAFALVRRRYERDA